MSRSRVAASRMEIRVGIGADLRSPIRILRRLAILPLVHSEAWNTTDWVRRHRIGGFAHRRRARPPDPHGAPWSRTARRISRWHPTDSNFLVSMTRASLSCDAAHPGLHSQPAPPGSGRCDATHFHAVGCAATRSTGRDLDVALRAGARAPGRRVLDVTDPEARSTSRDPVDPSVGTPEPARTRPRPRGGDVLAVRFSARTRRKACRARPARGRAVLALRPRDGPGRTSPRGDRRAAASRGGARTGRHPSGPLPARSSACA